MLELEVQFVCTVERNVIIEYVPIGNPEGFPELLVPVLVGVASVSLGVVGDGDESALAVCVGEATSLCLIKLVSRTTMSSTFLLLGIVALQPKDNSNDHRND